MKEVGRYKQARAEFAAVVKRNRRELEKARERWGRACLPLVNKAKTVREALVAFHHSPLNSKARQKALEKAADLCNSVDELEGFLDRVRPWGNDFTAASGHIFRRWMKLCASPEDTVLRGRISERLMSGDPKRVAAYEAKRQEYPWPARKAQPEPDTLH